MDLERVQRRLSAILTDAEGWLPQEQLADMQSLVTAGEPGVALENFCTQLEEYDVTVPRAVVDDLREIAAEMGMKLSGWMGRDGH